jgi:hypothetical protein
VNMADRTRNGGTLRHRRPFVEIDGARHYRCTICKTLKPETDFRAMPNHPKTFCGRESCCLECRRKQDRENAKRRRNRPDSPNAPA